MLVQGGIYGFVRHPIYLGLLFGLPGFVLAFRNWLVLPVSLLTGLFVIMRIYQEDQLLSNQFGLEFEAYRGRTTRLIPYIY
jgi:protein-S-isoprenylcysteine O-methyltransferase Ste14